MTGGSMNRATGKENHMTDKMIRDYSLDTK